MALDRLLPIRSHQVSTINRRQALALALTTAMPTAVFSQPGGAGFGKQERDALNLARAAASGR